MSKVYLILTKRELYLVLKYPIMIFRDLEENVAEQEVKAFLVQKVCKISDNFLELDNQIKRLIDD